MLIAGVVLEFISEISHFTCSFDSENGAALARAIGQSNVLV